MTATKTAETLTPVQIAHESHIRRTFPGIVIVDDGCTACGVPIDEICARCGCDCTDVYCVDGCATAGHDAAAWCRAELAYAD